MIIITIKDILKVLDAAKKKGLVKFGTNDKFDRREAKYNSFGNYHKLYYVFYFDNKYEVILDENHADTNWLYGRSYLVTLTAYYICYFEVFGTEPFNLVQEFYDSVEIGEEYGWHGDTSFDICIGKKITNEHTITVNLINGFIINGLPILCKQTTLDFDFSIDNKNLMSKANLFNNYFEYPHRGYRSKEEKDEKDLNGKTLVQAAKETIEKTQTLLEVLNNIIQKNETP